MNNRFNVRFSWSVYDWANSAWSAIIITFIFAEYFVNVLAPDKDLGTLYWTWTIGLSSLVAALLSPILGSISDQSQRSKYWLILSTFIYSFVAFALIRKGFYCKGIIFLFYSVSKWPFRYEWFKVIVNYIRYFLSLKKGLPERD